MIKLCSKQDLVANSGVCARYQDKQIALFYLPQQEPSVFAVDNWDPIGKANVMSRGIVGSIGDELVVASPLYKQRFSLRSGQCLDDQTEVLTVYPVELNGESQMLYLPGK